MDMCIDRNETIEYYNNNAKEYFDKSVAVDMSQLYKEFLKYVPSGGSILDIGCGSGRDLKYFVDHGYVAEGIEASPELNKLAIEYSGCCVHLDSIQNFKTAKKFDALWACASLLHLRQNELVDFFRNISSYLLPGGIAFISMKTGIKTGLDKLGRYFLNFDDVTLNDILHSNDRLQVIGKWKSCDSMGRADFEWYNVILKLE